MHGSRSSVDLAVHSGAWTMDGGADRLRARSGVTPPSRRQEPARTLALQDQTRQELALRPRAVSEKGHAQSISAKRRGMNRWDERLRQRIAGAGPRACPLRGWRAGAPGARGSRSRLPGRARGPAPTHPSIHTSIHPSRRWVRQQRLRGSGGASDTQQAHFAHRALGMALLQRECLEGSLRDRARSFPCSLWEIPCRPWRPQPGRLALPPFDRLRAA